MSLMMRLLEVDLVGGMISSNYILETGNHLMVTQYRSL